MKWVLAILGIAGVGAAASKLWPDIARYLKMREM
jgi:hypothetical protein